MGVLLRRQARSLALCDSSRSDLARSPPAAASRYGSDRPRTDSADGSSILTADWLDWRPHLQESSSPDAATDAAWVERTTTSPDSEAIHCRSNRPASPAKTMASIRQRYLTILAPLCNRTTIAGAFIYVQGPIGNPIGNPREVATCRQFRSFSLQLKIMWL